MVRDTMKCELCGRDNLSARELAVHRKYFHARTPKEATQQPAIVTNGSVCPDCGRLLVHEEGCMHCTGCGFSKCG